MKITQILAGLLLATTAATPLRAQVSAFTYQGRLNLNGAPANGYYDFMFRLLNDPTNGVAAPVIPIALAVPVSNGLFTTGMDFGAENFDGANRWLEINVRTNGGGPFTTLSPRQLLTPTPYAIAATTASNLLGALPAGQISGTILNASLPASPIFSGTVTASNFSGNGAGLTDVSAATLGGLSSSDFWRTTGNAGTTAGTHFLGTTDNQPLEFKVNGLRALLVEFAGDSDDPGTEPDGAPNIVGGSQINFVAPGVVGATISGGGATNLFTLAYSNSVFANFGAIAGGRGNQIESRAEDATISGGDRNRIGHNSWESVIGGGEFNTIETNAWATVIGGGYQNSVGTSATYCTIGGGNGNAVIGSVPNATIGGGMLNFIRSSASDATIGGGRGNDVEMFAIDATIAGGFGNKIRLNAHYDTIGGGIGNTVERDADYVTVGGGERNLVATNADHCVISGGRENRIESSAIAATIAGGEGNLVQEGAKYSVISGGQGNRLGMSAMRSTIVGGYGNRIDPSALSSIVSGGDFNTIESLAEFATIPGGYGNMAASYSFAAGNRAKATNQGVFVWGDSIDADITSTNANSVTMRGSGGYRLFTDTNATTGAFLAAGSGSWTSMSDRNAKENLRAADAREVLEKVVALPVQTWNYKSQDASIRHIGPMAQDFKAAFGVGESDTGIATVDADGVALVAIQGLNQKLEETRAENEALKQRLAQLEQAIEKLGITETKP
jgi:hypothetical protein